jgi:hypothetical protein
MAGLPGQTRPRLEFESLACPTIDLEGEAVRPPPESAYNSKSARKPPKRNQWFPYVFVCWSAISCLHTARQVGHTHGQSRDDERDFHIRNPPTS